MEKTLPSGLSVADLIANLPSNWFRISKAKRGPKVIYGCRFCLRLSKTKTCAMATPPPSAHDTAERFDLAREE